MTAKLYIVATPIGNLKDITLRALEVLKSADYIVCEDTRVTGKLLSHYKIKKPMLPLNDFNETRQAPKIVDDYLLQGKSLALVSDAGTPLISDPGFKLVREAIEKGVVVESIPGPSSVIAALTVSGLPPDKFLFVGYLPKKDVKRQKFLEDLKKAKALIKATIVAFESPYRISRTLEDIKNVFGDIEIVICRELTKMHEEVRRRRVSVILDSQLKGEFVVLM